MPQTDPHEMRSVLSPYFVSKREFYSPFIHQALTIPMFQSLPALRGFWPCSGQYESASGVHEVVDLSGCGQNLTETGDPVWAIGGTTHTPHIRFSGTGEWCSSPDSAHWDITGTEAAVGTEIKGLTIGAWVYFDGAPSTTEYIIAKYHPTTNRSYWLSRLGDGTVEIGITADGNAVTSSVSTGTISGTGWHFVVGRFDPSTKLSIFLDGSEDVNVTSIPASIYAGIADLTIAGRHTGLSLLDGLISMAFVCAAHIPDYALIRLYEISRITYGVD